MFYDFVEIGTCDFDTEIQKASDETVGLSVEALQIYLDRLPNKANVKKFCAAITHGRLTDDIEIFYVPRTQAMEHLFKNKKWIFGCNSISKPHRQHLAEDVKPHFTSSRTKLLNVSELISEFDVSGIGLLKIDTEGHDNTILAGFIELFDTSASLKPRTIIFETNSLSPTAASNKTIAALEARGYRVVSRGLNTTLVNQ